MARSLEVFRDELTKMQDAEQRKAEGKDAELKNVVTELSARLSRLAGGGPDGSDRRDLPRRIRTAAHRFQRLD